MLIIKRPWQNILVDFVIGLPIYKGKNIIIVVVDIFIKERYFITCFIKEKGTSIEATTYIILEYIWKLYRLPNSIILDYRL
jgi:hypothetical protein